MLANYKQLEAKLESGECSHPEQQILRVSLMMLEEFLIDKTRDVKRRLR